MARLTKMGAAMALLLSTAVIGARFAAGTATPSAQAQTASEAQRKILYWKDPDGKPDYAPGPAKTADGRDYLPVYEDEEKGMSAASAPAKPEARPTGKILYYRNPMGLPDTSPVPKKDWMGMDYIAVYEGEDQHGSAVRVSLDKVQRTGVRVEEARLRKLARPIRAPGIAKPDERTMHVLALRADAFVEKLYVNETGKHVAKGEPLLRIYSPLMVKAQTDYQVAARDTSASAMKGAEQRLNNLDLPPSVLAALRRTGEPLMSIDWPAPVSGFVMEKRVIEGQMARMGDELFRFADLSSVWVIADIPEQDLASIKVGDPAKVTFKAVPNETFTGQVTFILHELDAATRTAKVRIEVKNHDHEIKHEMYADVEIDGGASDKERLAVPNSAIIDSGNRQVVLLARGEGLFEPRPVKLGTRGEGYTEIVDGIAAGDSVVVSATFLIDAESNLKAALSGFTAEPKPAAGGTK